MTEERWRRLEALFHSALDVTGGERDRFIERETDGDADLRNELCAMLRHADGAGERIARTVQRMAGCASGASHWIGRRFGPYRIVREIGRGGMGLVFEAWRDDAEYDKRVALKVAPDWRDLEGLRERFRKERQILARLEHPNVARFLDGGTEDGIPWFAMEFVDGKPITEWALARGAGVRERVALFQQVCEAVSYAHENLIIHRDLKPANILVDSTNTPKLLDFGIAALLDAMAEKTAATIGAQLWTPDYTSPEQLRGGAVTVRTDVYSLGLILYELLCGERAQVADASSPLALDQSICEAEPPAPSERVAARGDYNLSRQLRGDLDTIAAMAMRKEPERRYSSATALNTDLGRYLSGRPVAARPSTPLYRLSKLLRRHWAVSVAAGLLAVSVGAGIGSTIYQSRRAERRFEQVRGLANAFIFDVHDRIQYLPGATEARKAIVATALRYLETLRRDAGNDPGLVRELAAGYERIGDVQGNPTGSSLGDTQGALESYRRAEELLAPLAGRGDPAAKVALLSAFYSRAKLEHSLGNTAGLQDLHRARAMALPVIAEQPRNLAALTLAANIDSDIARLESDAGRLQPALEAARESVSIAQRAVELDPGGEQSRDYLAVAKNGLGSAYLRSGKLELAAQTFRESLRIREQLVKEHPENVSYRRLMLLAYGHVGDALGPAERGGLGQIAESAAAFQRAAEIAQWISQRDPSDSTSVFDLAAADLRTASSLLDLRGEAAAALLYLSRGEAILSRLAKNDPANQRYRLYSLVLDCDSAKALYMLRRYPQAAARLERARLAARTFAGGANAKSATSWALAGSITLGEIRAAEGQRASALALANEIAAGFNGGGLVGNAWNHALNYQRLGALYSEVGQKDAAAVWLRKSIDQWRAMKVVPELEPQRQKMLAAAEARASAAEDGHY